MMKTTTAQFDDYCECCGYPFGIHDKCIDVVGDGYILACSKKCAKWIVDNELSKTVPIQNLSSFV